MAVGDTSETIPTKQAAADGVKRMTAYKKEGLAG